jgi:hypothetical protein
MMQHQKFVKAFMSPGTGYNGVPSTTYGQDVHGRIRRRDVSASDDEARDRAVSERGQTAAG